MKTSLRFALILFSTFCLQSVTFSQDNNWTGGTGNWDIAGNWSLGIPTASHDVKISSSDNVTIPAGVVAVAMSVELSGGSGNLTIASTGSLTINGTSGNAFSISGANCFLDNAGTITIGNTTAPSGRGFLINNGTFTNSGTITVADAGTEGFKIFANGKTLNNSGTIKIGTAGNVFRGFDFSNGATFNNLLGGVTEIDNTTQDGIYLNHASATFNNEGMVKIGQTNNIGVTGINLANGSFDNKSGSTMDIDKTTQHGLIVNNSTASFTNSGTVNIGKTTAPSSHGIVFNQGSITNNSGATIEIGSATFEGIVSLNSAAKTLNNSGTIKIGTTGNVRDGLKTIHPFTFNNLAGSVLEIDNTTSDGIEWNDVLATFNNQGTARIGGNTAIGSQGINLLSSTIFDNKSGGVLEIDQTTNNGIFLNNANANFTNAGTVKIGSQAAVLRGVNISNNNSFDNQSGGIIEISNVANQEAIKITGGAGMSNSGSITYGKSSQVKEGLESTVALSNAGTMVFNLIQNGGIGGSFTLTNNSGATIEIPSGGFLQLNGVSTLTNNGTIKGEGELKRFGTLTNSATAIYAPGASPGKLTVTGALNLGDATYNCEINGTGQGTTYGTPKNRCTKKPHLTLPGCGTI